MSKLETIVERFNLKYDPDTILFKSYNICGGQYVPALTSVDPKTIQSLCFGYRPNWWTSDSSYLLNLRAEGKRRNLANAPSYKGGFHIITDKNYARLFRTNRCLIFANCFYQWAKGHDKSVTQSYAIYHKYNKIFAFGGLWLDWFNSQTGEQERSFILLTTYPNDLVHDHIGHKRMPVIINYSDYHRWLSPKSAMRDITPMLHPMKSKLMNAFPVG